MSKKKSVRGWSLVDWDYDTMEDAVERASEVRYSGTYNAQARALDSAKGKGLFGVYSKRRKRR